MVTLANVSDAAAAVPAQRVRLEPDPSRGHPPRRRPPTSSSSRPFSRSPPGEQRNIRIGTAAPPGASEKTFRIFIEELPAPAAGSSGGLPGQVTIRTRLGIPIFLGPRERSPGVASKP